MTRSDTFLCVRERSQRTLAEWTDSMAFEIIECPEFPEHRRSGRRVGDLEVRAKGSPSGALWTTYSDLLVQDHVVAALRTAGIRGFDVRRATVLSASGSAIRGENWWEIVVTGWGGIARPESGIHLEEARTCRYCGYLAYSACRDPSQLIDSAQWDGSDLFMVWPLPKTMLATHRLVSIVETLSLTEVKTVPLSRAISTDWDFTPGLLSLYLSPSRIAQLSGVSEII
jgi:hypothetical protein